MIKLLHGNIYNSNFIINFVSAKDMSNDEFTERLIQLYPHVEREYLKYQKHCNKISKPIIGTSQFVPVDFWAIPLCDLYENNKIEAYDKNYAYIVNVFVQNSFVDDGINVKTLKNCFNNIKEKAEKLNASIAIPECYMRNGAVRKVFRDVFDSSRLTITVVDE